MSKLTALKNISLIFALVVAVYLVANHTGSVKNQIMEVLNMPGASVKGVSTKRAEAITQKLKSDVISQVGIVQDQLLNVTLSDAIGELAKLQKIPNDIHAVSEFSKQQVDNMLQSKKHK